ncbi:MAG: glutathione S-transferase family protein [Phenylobacterium sp.]|uniref:glutathione S-transferase family protein n=1 Tax=Phenylobacterium sp. TaxID=1871053 RepID=UPI0027192501|nr:glutathione S-transferase family protein [Phenylobacterium sp.]MDO8900783.1 glutathione S-transferase family protein [Phenylobacterium sp.]MDP2213522.1 glutathione S-transferase family protein [Phenylobacterium sp.]
MELIIGTRRWSTWSLRPWLALRKTGAAFTETEIELRRGEATQADLAPYAPSGLAPVLKDGDLTIWDSLAICEYLAERYPAARLWPDDPRARGQARAASAQMHSGFASLRGECPMALDQPPEVRALSPATQEDIRKLVRLWRQMLDQYGGPFLAGPWSIADAFFTPVATRLRTYGQDLSDYGDDGTAGAYVARLLADEDFLVWEAAANA